MHPKRYARLTELVQVALETPAAERAALLERIAAEDSSLAREVTVLIASANDPANPFSEPTLGSWREAVGELLRTRDATALAALPLPERIGPFNIVRLLGSGGMGIVFEAAMGDPPQPVALKLLRPQAAHASAVKRFQREATILDTLQHDGIARVLDAGFFDTEGQRPYFVMELVRGIRIDAYCAERTLPLRDRVELIARVCDAVEHAHTQGVVHRDLKPDNILVDGEGRPKVLDFGVARIDGFDPLSLTRTGEIVGTLAYMSPEQFDGSHEISPATDVYALGAILFELLAGQPAHDVGNRPLSQVARILCRNPAPRLGSLGQEFAGDLEQVVAYALEKDPHHRYASAGALGANLRRYLNGERIEPASGSLRRRLSRFVARSRDLFGRRQNP